MKVLDGDSVRLKDAKGRKAERDIVQVETVLLTVVTTDWRYVALVVVLWCPALSSSASVTAHR